MFCIKATCVCVKGDVFYLWNQIKFIILEVAEINFRLKQFVLRAVFENLIQFANRGITVYSSPWCGISAQRQLELCKY